MDRLTQFPDIYPSDHTVHTEAPWSLPADAAAASVETVVLSWAALLHAYTGEEQPVLTLNQSPVRVQLAQKSIINLSSIHKPEETEIQFFTGIFIQHPTEHGLFQTDASRITAKCALSCSIDLMTGTGFLKSEAGILPHHLKQLAGQLLQFVRSYAGLGEVVDDGEKLLLSIANPEPQHFLGPQFLHELAFQHTYRDAPALEFLKPDHSVHSISFEDLDCLSTQLAHQIVRSLGPSPSSRIVPVFLGQSVELYIAWLAVLKAGAAFCPLGTDSPEDRITFILKDVAAEVVVTSSQFKTKLASTKAVSLVLVDHLEVEHVSTPLDFLDISPEDLAYVMYTSGSTGRPKGVTISHRAVTQSLLAHDSLIPPFRRFLQFASPTFDVSVFEVFFPWFRGATLVGADRSIMLHDLPNTINMLQVDAAELTPTVAAELLRSRQSVPSLHVLLTIGEMLTKRVVDEFGTSATNTGILHGMYGPTEAAIHCTAAPNFHANSRVNLIGQPLKTVSAFVMSLDENVPSSEPVILPIGQIGELVVGGPQLAQGYINRPVENSRAFLRTTKYGRLYRTGDKARILPDGSIECLGRISAGQIKLRGQRVELGEIENVICLDPQIRSTVVGVVQGILIAWLLIEEGEGVQPEKMRQFCQKRLPAYMVPGDFIFLREFPRLESGKVDKKALEANYKHIHRTLAAESEMQFRDPLEENIAKAVGDVLNISRSYVASLSAAGLDSLTGIRLAARLREIGVNLDVGVLLTADTVREIWELSKEESKTLQEPSDQKADDEWNLIINTGMAALEAKNLQSLPEKVEPCSDTQLAMLSESLRDCRAYCNWVELEFRDGFQLTAVRQAFSKLIEYNEILRSVFLRIDLTDHPFCRVVWKTLNLEDYFQETTSFERDWSIELDDSIFVPLKVHFLDQASSTRVLVQIHHAIYDGWSWELLLDDLASALREEHLNARPLYSGVVRHDFQLASSKSNARTASYWEDHLRGAVPSTLPNFQSRYDIPTKIGQVSQKLKTSLTQVDEQARSMSISRQTFFQATLAYILSSYLDTKDVTVGTVFSGRTLPVAGIEATIGPCLRIFPNRVNLSWVRTIHDLLAAVHRNNRKALEYGDISLRQIKRLSSVANTSRLFDCLFVWQEVSGNTSRPNAVFEQVASADFLEFPLTIELEPKDGKLTATATFEESLFPAAQARLLLEQIDSIATVFSRTPDLQLGLIDERLPSSVLSIENDQFVHLDDLPSLAYQVEQLAAIDPNRNAVEFLHFLDPDTGSAQAEPLTYCDLNQQSNRLAHHIISCGVRSGDLVGIILDKSLDLYISILAVIKVGAGYVPLTPSTPRERIRTVLNETRPRVCIASSSIQLQLNDLEWLHLVNLESVDILQFPDTNIAPSFQKDNIAYVVYTSGSTGKPKGVVITHQNIQSNIAVLAEIYPIGTNPKFLQACSQTFDVSVFEIFFSWHCGMTLCSATNDVMFRDIEEVIRNRNITHLSLTPTVAALIRPENVPKVRLLVTAGEGLTAKVHHDWAGKGLYQGYGPSETTNICTVQPNVATTDNLRNIGKPFKNTSAFVISGGPGFSLLPRGAVGEFCFGGDQVGQGYLNRPDLTSEKFLNHAQFGRLYRSGDFGRLLPDGSLMFVGRRDDQVKLRGQRVELGEINSTVLRNNQVKDSASMIVGDHSRQQLVTFFVAKTLSKDSESDDELLESLAKSIFESLAAHLAPYMVPTYLIPMEAIPMTGVKKIDLRRLKENFESLAPDDLQKFSRFQGTSDNIELTEDEKKVARIISQTTKTPLELLKSNTSLYSIGIDSISAIHVARQLREAGFGQVDVSLILRNGSISELARAIGDKGRQEQLTPQDTETGKNYVLPEEILQKVEKEFQDQHVEMVIPCTALQESMLSRTISKEENAYCNHVLFEFKGGFEKLRHVMQEMACRHEILRTCFVTTTSNANFSFVQVILQQIDLPWVEVKATDLKTEISNQKAMFAQHTQQPRAIPYSIAAITDAETGKQMLLFSIHHALHDGEAMDLLFKEVESSYAGIESSPSPTQFRDFVNYVFARSRDEIDPFWTEYLHDISRSLLLPTPESFGENKRGSIEIRKSQLKISLTEAEALCRGLSVTLPGLIQGAWARLLSIYTNSSDICFGNVFSGRTTPIKGIESMIGPCFSVLPVRVHVNPTTLNIDVVKTVHKANLEIMGYQHTSLRQIQKSFSGKPLFDSIVLLQPPVTELDSELWELISEEGDMDFRIILELIPSVKQDSISVQLHVNSSQVPDEDADSILKDFADLFVQTLRYPLARANDLDQPRELPEIAKKARDFKEAASKPKANGSSDSRAMTLMFSEEELKVRDIVSRLSGCDPQIIRHDTTIFQLGLDSINAIQLSALLRDAGFSTTAANILENPSIRQIATLLKSPDISSPVETFDFSSFDSNHRQYVENRLNLGDKNIESIRPCTPVQAGMLAEFTNSRGDLYCNRVVLELKSSIDLDRLKASWSNIMARHEMLRTGFVYLENREFTFAMITYSPGQISLPWTERQTRPSKDELKQQRHSMYTNLHLPPWLIVIRNLPSSVVQLELTAMHSLYDAQSMELILSDVAAEYQDNQIRRSVPITQILGPILSASSSTNSDIDKFWGDVGSAFQSTSFPNLSPSTVREPTVIVRSQRTSKSLDTINEKCKAIGVTLQAAGQAAWARLLLAYTGETNISFGLVLSGRDVTHDAQDAVFPCLVTLPFYCVVEGKNRDFISSIVKTNASLMKYQFTPLSKIQRLFKADGALVDSLFAYQKLTHTRKEARLWEVVEDDARIDYPISMEMIPDDEGITLRVTCRSDVVPKEQADLILIQFDHLLADGLLCTDSNCVETSNIHLDLLSVTPAKKPRIPSPVSLLHEFVEKSAENLPDKTALEFVHGESLDRIQKNLWSYRELNHIGNKVARLLQKLDACKGGLVAICFDKCPEAYFAILGILKNGHAFVALDPGAPLDRKQFIVQDSRAKLLLSTSDKYEELGNISGVTTVALDTPGLLDDISPDQVVLERPIDPEDTCYCLYTSGTTGTPKGCEITHDNAVQAMQAFTSLFQPHWDEDSRWLQFASFHFDVSVLEQYWSWSVGICVTSCPRDLLFQDLAGTMDQLQITHVDLTPSLAKLITPEEVPSLCRGVFITGGETLKQEILDAWGKSHVIYNGYGPTEVTIGCTMLPRMDENSKSSNIGPQFDNVGSYVFQPDTTTPVLRGAIGELCVSGALVGRGYLNRLELTRERFQILDEFRERAYRTGDLVRILHDGSFQFLGRIDDQVKIRGQRLEIGEINAVIQKATPEISEVATLVIKHPSQMREQLVAFIARERPEKRQATLNIVKDERMNDIVASVQEFTKSKLPSYMVPTHIIPIPALPLSPNNKVDMKVLKSFYAEISLEQLQQLGSISNGRESINGEDVQAIVRALAEFAKVNPDEISQSTSIYDLGVDSISVIGLAQKFRDAGYATAQVSSIMKSPTVAGIASTLFDQKSNKSSATHVANEHSKQKIKAFAHRYTFFAADSIGIATQSIEDMAPCTPLQAGMVARFLESSEHPYCSLFRLELKPEVDLGQLQQAWSETQAAVQLLRARLVALPVGYGQVFLKHDELPWLEENADDCDIETISETSWKAWRDGLHDPSGPLWSLRIVKSPSKRLLCLNIFHALYDGNSLPLLLEQVRLRYRGQDVQHVPTFAEVLPHGPLQELPQAKDFWSDILRDVPDKRTFIDQDTDTSKSIVLTQSIDNIDGLDELKASLQVTNNSIFHACWLIALHKHLSNVPPLGIVMSGRALDIPGAESVVGPLFNTVPSYISFRQSTTRADLIKECHHHYISALPFQHTPLRDILKWIRRGSNQPLFEILFVFQKSDPMAEDIWSEVDSVAAVDYPLSLEVNQSRGGHVTATLTTKSHAFPTEEAEALLSTFREICMNIFLEKDSRLPDDNKGHVNGVSVAHAPVQQQTNKYDKEFGWTPTMMDIRNVIADLAGIDADSVHPEASIFELGLDSIDAVKLSSRLKHRGISLAVSSIMSHRSLLNMSKSLSTISDSKAKNKEISLDQMKQEITTSLKKAGKLPESTVNVLPPTPLQEAMVAEMIISDYEHYCTRETFEVAEHVDFSKLLESWKTVINAHDILRTTFVEIEDPSLPFSYAQIVHAPTDAEIPVFRAHDGSVDSLVKSIVDDQDHTSLDLRAVQTPDKNYIVLSIAHALYDGWSLDLLHNDVEKAYFGNRIDRPPYEATVQQILNSSEDSHQKFWDMSLKNLEPRQFPQGKDAQGNKSTLHRLERVFDVPSQDIAQFCKTHGITVQTLTLATWSLALAGFVKSLDVCFGLVLSGRNFADADEIMFPTMNTVAFRAILHGSRLDMLKYIQSTLGDLAEHQHYPLRKAASGVAAGSLFDTIFIHQKRPSASATRSAALYNSVHGSADTGYPLSVEMELLDESMICRLAARDDILGAGDAADILDQISKVFHLILSEPHNPTADFTDDGITVCQSDVFREKSNEEGVACEIGDGLEADNTWTELEIKIRGVLSVLSGIPQENISKDSTLFNLGLDSISAIKVCALLRQQSVVLPVTAMLKAGSIRKMAESVEPEVLQFSNDNADAAINDMLKGLDVDEVLSSNKIPTSNVERVLPATSGQTYCLALNAQNPQIFYGNFFYSIANVSRDQLDQAWKRLVALFPILRTGFISTGQRDTPFVQMILKEAENPVFWHGADSDSEFLRPKQRPIASGPVSIHAVSVDHGVLINLHIHHALYDAVSLPLIIDSLGQLCMGGDVPGNELEFSKFIAFQAVYSPLTTRKQFWENYLSGVETKYQSNPNGLTCRRQSLFQPRLVKNVKSLELVARRNGLSLQSLFMAVYARVYSQMMRNSCDQKTSTETEDLVLGIYLANRSYSLEGLSDLVAPTLNMVPLRIRQVKEPAIESAHQIQSDLHDISRVDHAGVSLTEIMDWTGVKLDVFVNFLRLPESENSLERVCISPYEPKDIALEVFGRGSNEDVETMGQDEDLARSYTADCIDVEIAVRDGGMDVGIFGPEVLLSAKTAESILSEIRKELEHLGCM